MPETVKLLVKGRVQGVFFRKSTQKRAQQLGLTGYVRNLPSGQVEIVAKGKKERIDELIDWAKEGPRHAEVRDITTQEVDLDTDSPQFKIIR